MGQNLVGWTKKKVNQVRGTEGVWINTNSVNDYTLNDI